MEKIRAEVRQRNIRKTEMLNPFPEPPCTLKATLPPGVEEPDHYSIPESRLLEFKQDGYHINDFLKYHEQDFVINAFPLSSISYMILTWTPTNPITLPIPWHLNLHLSNPF